MATHRLFRRSHRALSVPVFTFSCSRYPYHSLSSFQIFLTVPVPKKSTQYSKHICTHFQYRYFSVTRVTTLSTGLRVATESNNLSHTATVCAWVDTGSRFETEETNGVAHFVEHMVFRGTSKRSGCDIIEEVKNMGGELCGLTSREHTVYVAKVMAADVCNVVDVMSDMLQNSTFDDHAVIDERNEILTELFEVMTQPNEVIFDRLQAAAFQHSPLGRTVLGPPKNIMDMTKNALQDYLYTHYTPHRMVISASGAVNHDNIVQQVNNMFTKLSTNPVTASQLVEAEPAMFIGSEIRKRDDDMDFAHFGVVFKGASWTDPDSIALLVIRTMLGSWNKVTDVGKHIGSQLARIVGIDEIAESVMAVNSHYKETGLFGFYAVGKPDCLDDLASVIMQEISKLCYRVTEEDVIRAQNQLKYLFCKEQPTAEEIGRQLLTYGRRITLAELFARIDAVDVATVKRVANKFLYDKDIAIAASGPVKLLPDYNWFRSRTSMCCY
ncbi:putative mitochondrial-processing peptidase subunit beta, mitochondrial [Bidens hawaiensis]|uniref:putative mitochondrial-processing peptidase subunit beta, mitochondrial n=1 Tax=Bidens hawaiensis TaxID=980011 RepID=UPI004048F97D